MTPAAARAALEAAFDPVDEYAVSVPVDAAPGGARARAQTRRAVRTARRLVWAVLATVVLGVGWAAIARVDTTVRGAGRLVVPGGIQDISHVEGGIIAAILVQPGQMVARGQPLLRLDTTRLEAEAARDDVVRIAKTAEAERLLAEARSGGLRFDPALAASPTQVASEREAFAAYARLQRATLTTARARISEAEHAQAQAVAEQGIRKQASALSAREWRTEAALVDKGIEPAAALDRAQVAYAQAQTSEHAAAAAAARASGAVAETRASLREVVARARSEAASAHAVANADAMIAQHNAAISIDRVRRSILRAPVAGTIGRVFARTIGGVARPGETLVEIVPTSGRLEIEARFAARDIAAIRPGARARVRIAAFDPAVFGSLDGTVVTVASDTSSPAANPSEEQRSYLVRLQLIGGLHDTAGRALALRPGMTAEVDVIGPRRSILAYLLTPFDRLHRDAGTER